MVSIRIVRVGLLLCLGLSLAGCAEIDPDQASTPLERSESLEGLPTTGFVSLGEFEGSFDVTTGELRIGQLEADISRGAAGEYRVRRQAYGFCNDLSVNAAELGVGVNAVPGTMFSTVEECIPADEVAAWGRLFYTPSGAFCATVRIDNRDEVMLGNVIAEITEITAGYEGYTFTADAAPPCCGTGADLSGLTGPNVPTDLSGGAFLHAEAMAPGESAAQQWTFANSGGSFSFRGRIVAQLQEVDNGLDDDCDGRVDNGLGEYDDGAPCREDADCSIGVCRVDGDELGECARPCEEGTFGRACEACPIDCGAGGSCDDGLSGTGVCVCADGWASASCGRCAPGHWGSECAGTCDPCGAYGECSAGLTGDGRCMCTSAGYGPECQFSCANGVEDGDESGVDCGGPTCEPCPPRVPPCNGRGVPGAAVGMRLVTHGLDDHCDPLEERVCLQRGATGLLFNEAAGETTYTRATSPRDTAWAPGTCERVFAGAPIWRTFRNTVSELLRSAAGLELCMVATETGNAYDIEFVSWSRSTSEASGFSYLRTDEVCACEPGFHGADCESSCSDGIFNGSEDAVDCGGACSPCPDGEAVHCNFRGRYTETETAVDYVADTPCYRISDDVCLARTTGGPPFNVETGHVGGGRDSMALEGTLWAMGTCGEVVPWSQNPFNATGNSSGWMLGEWCVLDRSTGSEHSITVTNWEFGRAGGWSFTHIVQVCECDEGAHGVSCEHSCDDGLRSGDEVATDCGGACEECAVDWECNFNGVDGGVVEFEWDGSTCDRLSDGVCLARGETLGLYNTVEESSWTAESPAATRWSFGSCSDGDGPPMLDWRTAVWTDGDGPRWSIGELYCMLDRTTGIRYDITVTDWVPAGRGGGFSYRRTKECACARGFHGTDCSKSCSDGVRNGDEALVDCGGSNCDPCPERWECNHRGDPSLETRLVRLDGADCDLIGEATCLDRSRVRGGPIFNEASGASGGHDHRGLAGTAWGAGVCDETPPRDADPFHHRGNNTGWMLGEWCVLDRSTGIEHEVEFASWGSGRSGATTYIRTSPTCSCDRGAHGLNCEFSCSDGIQNGDETLVDCGGSVCEPCLDGWECGYNGTFEIGWTRVIHERNDPCYRISDGVCLGRSTVGGPPFNATLGRLGGSRDTRAMDGTLWSLGSCTLVVPSDDDPFGVAGNASGWQLQEWCMLDLSTGLEHTIDISSWGRGRSGAWSFIHAGGSCECEPGFHGSSCEFTCSDGVVGGAEDAIDCGGPCDPCEEGWQCHFDGVYTETTSEVEYEADGPCYRISDALCLGRSSAGGPPFNAAAGHTRGHHNGGLEESFWATGSCDEVTPLNDNPFARRRNATGHQLGPWCVLDRSTGLEHSIEIESWDNARGAGWSFTHTGGACECDPGAHGGACEFTCADGVANGEEDAVDCGGPCPPCLDGWQCSYNGTFAGTEVHYEHEGGDACDRVSDDVCIARGESRGIFNSETETSYSFANPTRTLWSSALSCGSVVSPSQTWRDAVWTAGTGPRSIVDRSFCMLDGTTDQEWTVVFHSWATGGTGGEFSYTRSHLECECDPGFTGETCAEAEL